MGLSPFSAAAVVFGAFAGLGGVALGGWAVHGLAGYQREVTETASAYAIGHGLAIIGAALIRERVLAPGWPAALLSAAILLFMAGCLMFSGALVLSVLGITTGTAPFGGMALMGGWLLLAAGAIAAARSNH